MNTSHSQVRASTASSSDVRTAGDESVGSIKEFMINIDTGQVDYVVLKVGDGFLNLGSKLLALPFESFEFGSAEGDVILVRESKETLRNAPGFDKDNWPSGPQPEFLHDMRSYYSEESRSLHGRYDQQNKGVFNNNQDRLAMNSNSEQTDIQNMGDGFTGRDSRDNSKLTEGDQYRGEFPQEGSDDLEQSGNLPYRNGLADREDREVSTQREEQPYGNRSIGDEYPEKSDRPIEIRYGDGFGGEEDISGLDRIEDERYGIGFADGDDPENSDDLEDTDDLDDIDLDNDDLDDDDESVDEKDSKLVDKDQYGERPRKGDFPEDSESDDIRRKGENTQW